MIRGFFRLVGLLLLAGGFIFMVYDGARWVADNTLRFTRFGQFWNDVHQSSQQAFRIWVEGLSPWLWNNVVRLILDQPVFARKTTTLPSATEALPGRTDPIPTATRHFVNGQALQPPYPTGLEQAV